jgi:hypothetical protein
MHHKLLTVVRTQWAYAAVVMGFILTVAWLAVLGWFTLHLLKSVLQ